MMEIPRSVYDAFGGTLESRVAGFLAALDAHRHTVGEPAPAEHPLVEAIARAGGMAAVTIVDDPVAPAPAAAGEVAKLAVVERIAAAGRLREARAALKLGRPDAELSDAELLLRERWLAARTLARDDAEVRGLLTMLGLDPDAILA